MSAPVVICGGGTGGHITPGLAIAAELRKLGIAVAWLGTQGGMEERLVPDSGIELRTVRFSAPAPGLLGYFKCLLRLLPATVAAMRHLVELDARLVLGMGGYPSLPGMVAGCLRRTRRLLHEQNVIPGLANRAIAPMVHGIMVSHPPTFAARAPQLVGNPVRSAFVSCPEPAERMAGRAGPLRLLVIGGSLGAASLNTGVPRALAAASSRWQVEHFAGHGNVESTEQAYAKANVAANVSAFSGDIAAHMLAADLVICRGGASTIAELACVGVAAVLVPYPYAAAHQRSNAGVLCDAQAAEIIDDEQLANGAALARILDRLAVRDVLQDMAHKARLQAWPHAAQHAAQACQKELGHAA